MAHDDLYRAGIGMTSQRTRERLLERLFEEGIRNLHVLEAIRRTPRHLFVDEALAHRAYEDTALPIGHNQTLSQPYIVARMTELLLGGGPLDKVMEVGTGSGYQTAILAQVVERVFSVERIYPLQERAKGVLRDINIRNVVFRHADGNWGWPQYGPYDAILVTAAPAEIPPELLGQLADGGRLVIPVGEHQQHLMLVVRQGDDQWFNIVKWVLAVQINAEELGVTSANVDDMLKSDNPNIQRLLGTDGDMGAKLGLPGDFGAKIVKQVGNYGEMYDRNVGPDTPLGLERGINALWTEGGVMYAPPVR